MFQQKKKQHGKGPRALQLDCMSAKQHGKGPRALQLDCMSAKHLPSQAIPLAPAARWHRFRRAYVTGHVAGQVGQKSPSRTCQGCEATVCLKHSGQVEVRQNEHTNMTKSVFLSLNALWLICMCSTIGSEHQIGCPYIALLIIKAPSVNPGITVLYCCIVIPRGFVDRTMSIRRDQSTVVKARPPYHLPGTWYNTAVVALAQLSSYWSHRLYKVVRYYIDRIHSERILWQCDDDTRTISFLCFVSALSSALLPELIEIPWYVYTW